MVDDSQRLFNCDRCSAQVAICGRCDRGQRYCGAVCAKEARRESQRASNRRYQATHRAGSSMRSANPDTGDAGPPASG